MNSVRMFVNGQGMQGGEFNDSLAEATFLGPVTTSAKYRFYAVRDEFPGLYPVDGEGVSVPGELYELPYGMLANRLLPREPPELELGIIELADGSGSLSMRMRAESLLQPGVTDISHAGGWRAYLASRGRTLSASPPVRPADAPTASVISNDSIVLS